jgi:orotidine-5'-phosphate decarboxylase
VRRSSARNARRRQAAADRLVFALDVEHATEALELVDLLVDEVGCFKIGTQLFLGVGPDIVHRVRARGGRVFLDLKFHDIPQTVANAAAAAARLGVRMFTVHAAGGREMLERCVAAARATSRRLGTARPDVLAVTVLTSLGTPDLRRMGVPDGLETQVVRLARQARRAGADGVVASPLETARIRRACGPRALIVTPGVRLTDDPRHDQKRVMGPEAAIRAGADYLVVGRPIRDARDPVAAARQVTEGMARGLVARGALVRRRRSSRSGPR